MWLNRVIREFLMLCSRIILSLGVLSFVFIVLSLFFAEVRYPKEKAFTNKVVNSVEQNYPFISSFDPEMKLDNGTKSPIRGMSIYALDKDSCQETLESWKVNNLDPKVVILEKTWIEEDKVYRWDVWFLPWR